MLNNLKWKATRFMYGRYGVDQIYMASGVLFILLTILQIFLQSTLLNILTLVLIAWTFYRVFSKDISSRRTENEKFMTFVKKVKSKWKIRVRRIKDLRTHRYRTCSACGTTLRLPRKRGIHKVRCPKCRQVSDVKIFV